MFSLIVWTSFPYGKCPTTSARNLYQNYGDKLRRALAGAAGSMKQIGTLNGVFNQKITWTILPRKNWGSEELIHFFVTKKDGGFFAIGPMVFPSESQDQYVACDMLMRMGKPQTGRWTKFWWFRNPILLCWIPVQIPDFCVGWFLRSSTLSELSERDSCLVRLLPELLSSSFFNVHLSSSVHILQCPLHRNPYSHPHHRHSHHHHQHYHQEHYHHQQQHHSITVTINQSVRFLITTIIITNHEP